MAGSERFSRMRSRQDFPQFNRKSLPDSKIINTGPVRK